MKIKCRSCEFLNYDCIANRYDNTNGYFCGLHGCAQIDPDGQQVDLDHHGSCGYIPKQQPKIIQLSFDFGEL